MAVMAQVWLERRDCENDDFPEACLKCGRPTTQFVKKTFSWTPGWVYVTVLINLLVFIIVAAVTTKTLKARVPMCDEHRKHWFWRNLILLGIIPVLIAGIVGLVIAVESMRGGGEEWLLLGIPGLILLCVVMAIVISLTAIRPTKISERGVRLTGVSEAFVDAYEDYQRQFQPHIPDIDQQIAQRWGERKGGPSREKEEPGRYQREEDDQERRGRERYREDY
jgi:hypothetical protein